MWNALTYLYVTWLNIVTKYCHKYYIKLFFGTRIQHHILLKMAVCCLRKKSEIVKNNIIFLHFYKDKLYRSVAIWHLSYGQFHGRFNVNSDYNLQFLSNAVLLWSRCLHIFLTKLHTSMLEFANRSKDSFEA